MLVSGGDRRRALENIRAAIEEYLATRQDLLNAEEDIREVEVTV